MYRAKLMNIYSETTGAYKVYGIYGTEVEYLRRQHNGKISGSNGTYTVFDDAVTKTYLVLLVGELNIAVKLDVRQTILALTGRQKLTEKFYKDFKANADYFTIDKYDGKWRLVNPSELHEVCKKMGVLKR